MMDDATRMIDLSHASNSSFDAWLHIKFMQYAENAPETTVAFRRSFATLAGVRDVGMVNLGYRHVQAVFKESYTSLLFEHRTLPLRCLLGYTATNSRFDIRVAGDGAHAAADVICTLLPPCDIEEGLPEVAFWSQGVHGPQARYRKLSAPAWEDVIHNYSERPAGALDRLMGIDPGGVSGRLLIWNGPPGTGKTSAIRTLINAWGSWCEGHYLLDPEVFFDSANYMMAVALGNENGSSAAYSDDSKRRRREWKLVVVEDADEFLTRDAKDRSGQGMARLLNITDGLPGQGMNLLVLITTNEDVGRLHPAILRPGRCLSHIEFPNLTADESRDWLRLQGAEGWGLVPSEGMSLAELYARVSNVGALSSMEPDRALGFVR